MIRMKKSVTAAIVAALLSVVAARVAPSDHVRHEVRGKHLDSHWTKENRIEGAIIVPVRVGLTQSNLDKGEAMLMNISHPNSEHYGKHLSASEVDEMFAPSKGRIDAVSAWLKSSLSDRVITLSRSRQWLELNATYHVPMEIRNDIDFITPGVMMLEMRKRADNTIRNHGPMRPKLTPTSDSLLRHSNDLLNCSFVVTPECIRAIYKVEDKSKGQPNNSIGIYSSQFQRYSPESLDSFFKNFAPEIPQGTKPKFQGIDGAPSPSPLPYDAAEEADMDFQAAYPLIYPDTAVGYLVDDLFYEAGGDGVSGLFNTFLDALDKSSRDLPGVDPTYPDMHEGGYDQPEMCGVYTPTNVISISYGEDSLSLPMNYQRRQCNEWMKLGLQGVTVIAASGDGGVGGFGGFGCPGGAFETISPVDCPYVTAVGATNITATRVGGKVKMTEQAARFSGGGFSNIFGTPSYQADAAGRYNRGGRGYPDVSAVGQNFIIWVGNGTMLAQGTSASAPVFAGMITRINSFRMNAGRKPVGFINPMLYQHREAFNDITSGHNQGCNTTGFSAVKGWDPITGLGTPDYSKLKEVFLRMP
ncbi:peptidase S8/S53 domain-containing protein [Trichoderma barbatum]